MLAKQQKYYTPEEYLALEESADYKSEYYQGEIFALAGASVNHNRLAGAQPPLLCLHRPCWRQNRVRLACP